MKTDKLFELLAGIYPLSNGFRETLSKLLVQLSLPKNHMFLEPPNIAGFACYIETGFAFSYTYIDGKKNIERLWTAGEIMISPKSFFEQRPSTEFIQLALPSELLCISYSNQLLLFDAHPETHFLTRAIMNVYIEHARERAFDMKNFSALERYHQLLAKFPLIEQILSQEQIASYIGVAPQSLSRMKRKGYS
jgi:CRP/FNR family transcriptional regulator, anaerobic regulatory protein